MDFKPSALGDLLSPPYDDVIDVRSPAEFAIDHIPGAINLPALSDEERAEVGTIYVQDSAFRARKIGAALVSRNAARHLEGPLKDKPGGWTPLVYCWRGGQRSHSLAIILEQIGWRVGVLEGGYRTYRNLVGAALRDTDLPHRLILLDGNTGTAKTELLARVQDKGGQVLDLEGLANHRGSVFGHMAAPQPSQKMFESTLAERLARLDPARPVLVEAESNRIGNCQVAPNLWRAMQAAPRILVSAPVSARAAYLTRAYGDLIADNEALTHRIEGLRRFHPRDRIEEWLAQATEGHHRSLATGLMEDHYDPRYAKSQGRTDHQVLARLDLDDMDDTALDAAATRLVELLV